MNNSSNKSLLYSRVLPTTVIGNALEFYDFTIYAIFAATIGKLFFPLGNPTASLIASWGTFAVGFMMRPLGAIVFGYLGDKFGRKYALSLTVLLTGAPTLLIGLLPGYAEIGLAAPLILITCRLLQGLCTGGEYNGAAVFALEHFGKIKPGMIGGIITASCVIGAFLATFAGFLISSYGAEWMWRLPFIFGALVSFVGFIIRQYMSETPEFSALQQKKNTKELSLSSIYKYHTSSSFISFMVGCLNGALSYTLFGFLNVYLSKYLGLELATAMKYNLLGLFFFMSFSPIAGYFLDCYGGERTMYSAALLVFIGAFPVFFLLQTLTPPFVLLGQAFLGILVASIAGSGHAYMQRLFPTQVRYRGISINFCLGMALCGGTAPMLLTYLIESYGSNLYAPAFYLMSVSSAFLISLTYLSKRIKARQNLGDTLVQGDAL
jgi:MHS family proline/betaine transporter-like MFS transporter